ncbi:hypothetical protein [Aquimarina muelleri]|uniref:Uncharacterized protein n=1 Tax=Aquimarina muelleri TaxID=279356 RepID=A0A918N3G9_9FLAO|nr:hypothetical protein [Aquimarina muelleri]MCX2763174.1 hypothetical protein [Aquimarina muelleri]GGX19720.1 hypothetical protein GCM10007384_21310 [Aquimarina muelleri]
MEYVIIKESQTVLMRIFSFITIIVYSIISYLVIEFSILLSILFFCIGIFLAGFSKVYKITRDFNNEILFILYGKIIWKSKFYIEYPDYISVFHASFVQRCEDDGTENKFKKWVIRFFKGNTHCTVLEEDNYNNVLKTANDLGVLLKVKVYDRSKE